MSDQIPEVAEQQAGPILLSVAETAAALGIHRASVYTLLAQGALPSVKIGRRRLVAREALFHFVSTNQQTGL